MAKIKIEKLKPDFPKMTVSVPKTLSPIVAVKVYALADKIKVKLPEKTRKGAFINQVKDLIGHIITEESTDDINSIIVSIVPFGLGWIVGKILDTLLPEKLLLVIYALLDRISD